MSARPDSLAARVTAAPRIGEAKKAQERLAEALREAGAAGTDLATLIEANPKTRELLLGLADYSPFLWQLCRADPARLQTLLAGDPAARLRALIAGVADAWRVASGAADLMSFLRRARQEAALLVALCDIGGLWTLEDVTAALSDFADAALASALRFLLAEAAAEGLFSPADLQDPGRDCGAVVLALGKLGAGELNYSSDIDIVVFFDPAKVPVPTGTDPTPFCVRLTKGLVKLLQERTADGYVFRVDLRLRPDPASTAVAISLPAAYAYYETVGQNWERAALIKARPVAGDLPLGAAFLAELTPFIWRKYFDFAAIADIHAMKRQIHAVRGHEAVAVAGHDIKLGRGGIREIEFFVQTQQLVFGGRRTKLRGRRTLDMLDELRVEGWISAQACRDLGEAYRFLRMIEHRLQMVRDEQTQRLPIEPGELTDFARFSGFSDRRRFGQALTRHALKVEKHYARLFEDGADLTLDGRSLVFTGTCDDPETLETLQAMGFTNPAGAAETVRGWHFGRRQAVTSARAREVVTELVPSLLASFAGSADPDGALAAFDRALARMPAAVELFSILKSNAAIRDLFADILGSAPRLADIVALRPHLLDAVIDPSFAQPFPGAAVIGSRLREAVGAPSAFEDFLDRLRDAGQQEIFLVGAGMLSGALSPALAGHAYAAVAEAIIAVALDEVEKRFRAEFGIVQGAHMAVVAMGRLGSREMSASSDLDLLVLYDFDEDQAESDGARRLSVTTYYTRLTQRLISALTVPTSRGTLYEVDMRLRPSGNKGPAATQFRGFLAYQRDEAETWEQLALTRARPIAGDASFRAQIEASIQSLLRRPRDAGKVLKDTRDMRALIAAEKGEDDPWELKLAAGGLLDIEFIAQAMTLCHAHVYPALATTGTAAILDVARAVGLLDLDAGVRLTDAYGELRDLLQWIRLTLTGRFDPETSGPPLKRRLAASVGLPDFAVLESHIAQTRREVRAIFERQMR